MSFVLGLAILGWALIAWRLPSTCREWRERALFGLLEVGTVLFLLFSNTGIPPTRPEPQAPPNALEWPQRILLALSVLGVIPAIVGFSFARRVGILAALVVVGAAYVVWVQIGDPDYTLSMWTDNRMLVTWISMIPALFFLLVVPMAVLWLDSTKAQIVSFLLPTCIAVAASIIAGYVIRPYKPSPLDLVVGFLWPVLPVVFALALYLKAAKDKSRAVFPA